MDRRAVPGRAPRPSPSPDDDHVAHEIGNLARNGAAASQTVLGLQSLVGNAAVRRIMADRRIDADDAAVGDGVVAGSPGVRHEVAVDTHRIEVSIPRKPTLRSPSGVTSPTATRPDSPAGEEQEPAAAVAAAPEQAEGTEPGAAPGARTETAETAGAETQAPGAEASAPAVESANPAPEPATAGTPAPAEATEAARKLPDISVPELAEIGKSDAVLASLGYTGSTRRGGAQPAGFGVTRSFGCTVTNIWVIPMPYMFVVRATVEHPVTYQIRSGTGPDGQVDISSATSPAITDDNYADVAADLTPDMTDLNGRPPRHDFWAENLTARHELVHCADDRANAPGVVDQIAAWLRGQSASTDAEVRTLLGQVPNRFASGLLAALTTEAGEIHAYGDGAPSYQARADAITEAGDDGEYA